MRQLHVVLGFVFLVFSLSAFAADTKKNDIATSFGIGSLGGLSFRTALTETTWVLVGASMGAGKTAGQDTSGGSTSSVNINYRSYTLSVGARQYLSKEKLSSYLQMWLLDNYSKSISDGNKYSSRQYGATAGYGLEYFLASNLSIEALAGVNFTYRPSSIATSNVSDRSVSFPVVGAAINYYW
jgi:outer membrane protein assembly factor BamA